MKKKQRGGRREGAGRKPAEFKMIALRGSYHPDVAQWLIEEAARRGMSLSALLSLAGEEFKNRHGRKSMTGSAQR
jgi:hypothetical protein